MDKAKMMNGLSRIDQLIPKPGESLGKTKTILGEENLFEQTLEKSLQTDAQAPLSDAKVAGLGTDQAKVGLLKFSNHAIERMQTRGISYSPESLGRLEDAVKKAASKGSKDTLVLMDDSALIVSVKNNTVVTVMDKNALKENVFTNIDSTVVI